MVTGAGAASGPEKSARRFDSALCPIGIEEVKLTPGEKSGFEPSALPGRVVG
jgi:hypothetical protein